MPQYKTAGTASFNELDFWLYSITSDHTLTAVYPEPFSTFARANAVMEAECKADDKAMLCIASLPPSEVNGKKSEEIMQRMLRLQALYSLQTPDAQAAKTVAEPVLAPPLSEVLDDNGDCVGPAYLYKHGRDLVLSQLTASDVEKNGVMAVGSGPNNAPIRADTMKHAVQLSMQLEKIGMPFTVIPMPFSNAAGASVKYVARELLNAMEARKTKSRGETAKPSPAPKPKRVLPELAVTALSPGEAYFRGEDCAVGMTITATVRDAAKMPDGGSVYGVCVETGRLYSTVTDGALVWKHIDGGMA